MMRPLSAKLSLLVLAMLLSAVVAGNSVAAIKPSSRATSPRTARYDDGLF